MKTLEASRGFEIFYTQPRAVGSSLISGYW